MPHCPRPTPRGFTLVELMVVVTVTALLAVLAWPSARAALLRSHRSDATAALLCLQLAQERHRAARGHYAADLVQLPRCGTSSADGHYRLSLVAGGPDQYLASATAVGPQAGDSGCERLTLRVDGAITEQTCGTLLVAMIPPRPTHRSNGGLTLLELMIALAVTATLAGLAVPSFAAALGRHRLRAAAEHLAADVAEARLEAARRGSAVHLRFQTGNQWCYTLTTTADGDCRGADSGQLKRVTAIDHPGLTLVDAEAMVFTGSDASGTLLPGHARFANARDESVQVRLSRLGRASVCSPGGTLAGATPC